jgi:hypothetical protein
MPKTFGAVSIPKWWFTSRNKWPDQSSLSHSHERVDHERPDLMNIFVASLRQVISLIS